MLTHDGLNAQHTLHRERIMERENQTKRSMEGENQTERSMERENQTTRGGVERGQRGCGFATLW
jgi:hypothetical protein